MQVRCVYNVKGLLHPLTDTVEVPDHYTERDLEDSLNRNIQEGAPAMWQDGARVRSITFVTPV